MGTSKFPISWVRMLPSSVGSMDHKKWLPCKVETASSLKNEHVGYMFLSKDLIKSVQTDSPLYSVYRLVERWWRAISLYFFLVVV